MKLLPILREAGADQQVIAGYHVNRCPRNAFPSLFIQVRAITRCRRHVPTISSTPQEIHVNFCKPKLARRPLRVRSRCLRVHLLAPLLATAPGICWLLLLGLSLIRLRIRSGLFRQAGVGSLTCRQRYCCCRTVLCTLRATRTRVDSGVRWRSRIGPVGIRGGISSGWGASSHLVAIVETTSRGRRQIIWSPLIRQRSAWRARPATTEGISSIPVAPGTTSVGRFRAIVPG